MLSLAVPVACAITFPGNLLIETGRDLLVTLLADVLVDPRGTSRLMAHALHEVTEAGSGTCCEVVSGMS